MKTSFKTNIRYNGKHLRMTVPASMSDKRFEAYYSNGTILVAQAAAGQGIKANYTGTKSSRSYFVSFGKKWVGSNLPKFAQKAEVTMDNGQITFKIPEQANQKQTTLVHSKEKAPTPVKPSRTYTKKADKIAGILAELNQFARDNEFEWEVCGKTGKAFLVKRYG